MKKTFKAIHLLGILILLYVGIVGIMIVDPGEVCSRSEAYGAIWGLSSGCTSGAIFWYALLAGVLMFPVLIFAIIKWMSERKGDRKDKSGIQSKEDGVKKGVWIPIVVIITAGVILAVIGLTLFSIPFNFP